MRRKLILIAVIAVAMALILALWQDDSSRRVLPDGSVFILSEVKIGQTNTYTRGSVLSKTLGRLAPDDGISIGGLTLQRPEHVVLTGSDGCEILSAEIQFVSHVPGDKSLLAAEFYRNYRLLISGDDGFAFVKDFNGFETGPDWLFSFLTVESFPRDSKQLRFHVQERNNPQSSDWHELTTFVVKNPKPSRIKNWQPEISPKFKISDDLEVQIGELTVQPEPMNPVDIWESSALLAVRFLDHGQPNTAWGLQSGPMWDASGNHDTFTFDRVITNTWSFYRIFRTLDPSKAWRFQLNVSLDTDFPATNLFSFTIPWPLSATLHTNLGGFPVQIDFVNRDMLSVELTNAPPDMRLSFVGAVDNEGKKLNGFTGSWGQHRFWQTLRFSNPTQVNATVAIHKNYPIEFTLQPHLDPPKLKTAAASTN